MNRRRFILNITGVAAGSHAIHNVVTSVTSPDTWVGMTKDYSDIRVLLMENMTKQIQKEIDQEILEMYI